MRAIRRGMDEPVVGLRRSQPVDIHRVIGDAGMRGSAQFGLRVAGVEEAGSVLRPGDVTEARPLDLVAQKLARIDVEHPDLTPIGATALHAIGDVRAVMRCIPFCDRVGAVLGPVVGVDQYPVRPVHAASLHGARPGSSGPAS